jgi:hypothetical protein
LKRIQRMPNIPLAYVSVYRRMSDIFHTLTYACTIRNSVTGPLTQTHFTDFNIFELLKDYRSLRGITKHYERLTMVHKVYTKRYEGIRERRLRQNEETSRKTTARSKFIHFFNVSIKFAPSLKRRKHSQVRVRSW